MTEMILSYRHDAHGPARRRYPCLAGPSAFRTASQPQASKEMRNTEEYDKAHHPTNATLASRLAKIITESTRVTEDPRLIIKLREVNKFYSPSSDSRQSSRVDYVFVSVPYYYRMTEREHWRRNMADTRPGRTVARFDLRLHSQSHR
jgi:hypothetical protein